MKKLLICLALCLALIVPAALAEIDLSGMTFDELVALKGEIDLALWASEEWQEVTVPTGVYHIGEDIPAGKWTIRPSDGHTAEVFYGVGLKNGGTRTEKTYAYEQITSPNDSYAKYNSTESVTWTLEDGAYFVVETNSVVFTPFAGNSFSFK